MKLSREKINQISTDTGFEERYLEKAHQLLRCLELITEHGSLQSQLVLKGGTALHLFHLPIPRLSVDIDLNYVGSMDVDEMQEDRSNVIQGLENVFQRMGLSISNHPDYDNHAGITWILTYESNLEGRDNINVDLNFLMRRPLFSIQSRKLSDLQELSSVQFPVYSLPELAGGKMSALFERSAVRDLYDANQLLNLNIEEEKKWRIAFVVYGARTRKDWRKISVGDITCSTDDLEMNLLPLLRASERKRVRQELKRWKETLLDKCRRRIAPFIDFTEKEENFLYSVVEKGEIRPALLTENKQLQKRIEQHPALLWKVQHVRRHFDLTEDD